MTAQHPPLRAASDAAPAQPASLADLFWSFSWLALQGFGGVLAVVQRELVERKRWLTAEEFVEEWAVAQILPGPNVVNFALMIGGRHFGLAGALSALAGMLVFPILVVLLLAIGFAQVAHAESARGALRGLGAVAAGLIAGTGFKLLPALRSNGMGRAACLVLAVTGFAAVAVLRAPLIVVLLGLGLPAFAWAWYRMGRA